MAEDNRSVGAASLTAAAILHLALFAALAFSAKPNVVPTGDAVPITIVSDAPASRPAAAAVAPEPQPARTEAPEPQAPPPTPAAAPPAPKPAVRPPPPEPARPKPTPPKPVPPKSAPTPKPTPKPVKQSPTPPPDRSAETSAKPSLDLDALQASLVGARRSAPTRPSFAARGPTHAETAPASSAPAGPSKADQAGLSQLLNRLWNPNCSVEGGDAVMVSLTFTVGYDGHVMGRVGAGGRESSSDPVVQAAARRAIDAVHQAEPYQPIYRGAQFRINFDAKKACANR